MTDFEIKIFSAEHVPEAAEIERLCFSEPWSEKSLSYMCSENPFAVAVVDKENGRLAAYGGVQYVLDEGNIVNIATHPDYRRRGLATAVMRELESRLKERGVEIVFLEVRQSNAGAIALYERLGFKSVGMRKNYYKNPVENAILMDLDLDGRT